MLDPNAYLPPTSMLNRNTPRTRKTPHTTGVRYKPPQNILESKADTSAWRGGRREGEGTGSREQGVRRWGRREEVMTDMRYGVMSIFFDQ